MKDYARELLDVWTNQGDQAGFDRATELLLEIRFDPIANAQREYSAIEAIIAVLRNRPSVSIVEESADNENGLDPILPALRSQRIIETAEQICWEQEDASSRGWGSNNDGPCRVTTQEVIERIERQGLTLGVQQPHAVIGTVLANAERFERIARNTFEKRLDLLSSPQGPAEPDDLPF